MNRQIVPLVAAALTLSLGTQARALPDLVADNTPPGWSFPSLPRSSGDATAVNCVLQAPPLPGESSNTWFNGTMRNIGPNSATGAFLALYLNDVLRTIQGPYNLASNAYNGFINYPSSVILKGGRHTLLSVADALGGVSETNESNNTWARQYIWSPMTLTPNSPVARSGDPNKFTIGSGPWMNLEGFVGETIINQWWYAFAAICTDGTTDFDVTLHTEVPSNVPQAGFAARTAFSAASGGHLDAVIIDKNHALPFTYYGGVARHSGSGDKVVQFEASPPGVIAGV
ncbi:MAG TPA: CARDB domain-containing protein, partial [Candidatus Eisenbacteria bacterium]|nr:CARDB domain-containing protein [Candidatus Eisenbacteria bacterium]